MYISRDFDWWWTILVRILTMCRCCDLLILSTDVGADVFECWNFFQMSTAAVYKACIIYKHAKFVPYLIKSETHFIFSRPCTASSFLRHSDILHFCKLVALHFQIKGSQKSIPALTKIEDKLPGTWQYTLSKGRYNGCDEKDTSEPIMGHCNTPGCLGEPCWEHKETGLAAFHAHHCTALNELPSSHTPLPCSNLHRGPHWSIC